MHNKQPIRILCIEDDPATGRLLQKRLTAAGYVVDLAHDGEMGLAAYRSGSYDVLCVDHNMPGLTGLEVVKALSEECALPPTIMVTGAGDESVAVEAMKLGASDYIIKDTENRYFDLITSVIQGALERQHLLEQKQQAELALRKAHDELEIRVRERTAELARTNEELRLEIGRRKGAEEEIRKQNEFLESVLESLTHPFYVIDVDTYVVVMANTASGISRSGLPSTCYAVTHRRDEPCDSVEHPCPVEEVKESKKPVVVEHIHLDEKGDPLVVEIHAYPIFDSRGNVTRVIEYTLDITARKAAENNLRELLETSSNIVQNIPSGLLIYQYQAPGELFLVNANREATRLTGMQVDSWRGQEFDEMWPNARMQGLTQALLRTMATGETFSMEEAVFKTDEIERFFRLRAFSMPGDLLGLWFEDVTELKQIQGRIRRDTTENRAVAGETTEPLIAGVGQPDSKEEMLRFLLIVDVEPVAGIVQKRLNKLGQSSTVVSSVNEAMKAVLEGEFSVIVCDLSQPETNGWKIAGTIRDLCGEMGVAKPPFVLIIESGTSEARPEAGVDLVVKKPIDVSRLLQVVQQLLRQP